jgi:hypothetical protein
VQLAIDAARAIGITFASIDVVCVDGAWRVLEINSGVMMEALGKLHPELVQASYDAALERVFGCSCKFAAPSPLVGPLVGEGGSPRSGEPGEGSLSST